MSVNKKRALLIVDLQNDFLPGGALPVPEGDKVVPVIDKLLKGSFDLKVASKDWHPATHGSFAVRHHKKEGERIMLGGMEQVLWPVHCVQGTPGADFAPGWDTSQIVCVFYKGTEQNMDSYSSFFDNGHHRSTGLGEFLHSQGVSDLYIAGLATDYCVKYSAIDACKQGFNTYVVIDACRGVNLSPGDSARAVEEMKAAGAMIVVSSQLL